MYHTQEGRSADEAVLMFYTTDLKTNQLGLFNMI